MPQGNLTHRSLPSLVCSRPRLLTPLHCFHRYRCTQRLETTTCTSPCAWSPLGHVLSSLSLVGQAQRLRLASSIMPGEEMLFRERSLRPSMERWWSSLHKVGCVQVFGVAGSSREPDGGAEMVRIPCTGHRRTLGRLHCEREGHTTASSSRSRVRPERYRGSGCTGWTAWNASSASGSGEVRAFHA